ncbi:alpha-amylase/subtilisin inhibitor-like [Magnolia sinica]|uniref:alpha-amylase/subtilisin inhibitor-like n=1 Tax=Magnolia sinica TaxID=86752 RepID=UPI00265A8A9F|nr:alpha-amylase/subtilisin inhibitor-like [Magnolia sinica]
MRLIHHLFALLLTYPIVWGPPSAEATVDAILDSDGHQLQPDTEYYILPTSGDGGGLVMSFRDRRCPLNVAQIGSGPSNGLPLTLAPVNASVDVVQPLMDVRITFRAATICVQSTVWRLGEVDQATGRRYVMTGPGASTVSSWFKIEKYGNGYKFVTCPGVCMACNEVCEDVGVWQESGKRWLGLSNAPLSVIFKRV